MKSILVTGADGFIGKNLRVALGRRKDVEVLAHDLGNPPGDLESMAARADWVFHLAGVNRPKDPSEFVAGNVEFTRKLCDLLAGGGRKPKLAFASTIQAALDNPYGISKKGAEEAVFSYGRKTGAAVHVFRLPNVFGKWCRPNYNSAVATFCHNVARGLPIQINNPQGQLRLIHVEDVVSAFLSLLDGHAPEKDGDFCVARPVFDTTVGRAAELIRSFAESRRDLHLPDMADDFVRKLYSTYISYLPETDFAYSLNKREDPRGALAEFIKSRHIGQLFVSTTRPGIVRGNHYHDTKVEKFMVISGQAVIRFEHILTGARVDVPVSGSEFRVVDIPPGYTHHIENVGSADLVVLFWADELFDEKAPDTYFREVRRG